MPTITLEEDAPPIVRILGVTLRRSAADPGLAKRMDSMKGSVALRSSVDPQAATIAFDKGHVHVTHGVAPDADVVISLDFNTLGQPGASKPRVSGAARHPAFALAVSKVLEPPAPGGWRGAVDEFWNWAQHQAGCPSSLRVVCSDDNSEVLKANPGAPPSPLEVHGPTWALLNVFTGGDHAGLALLEGRIRAVGDFPALTEFTGLITRVLLGDT